MTTGGRPSPIRSDAAALEDPPARLERRPGEAEGIVQGVEVAGVAIEETAEVALAAEHFGHLGARHEAGVRIAVAALQRLGLLLQIKGSGRFVGGGEDPGLEIAGNRVARDPLLDGRLGLAGELPEKARPLVAEHLFQRGLVEAQIRGDLAAVSPRGARPDPRRLQEHRVVAPLGQMEERREAGVAAADDADVGLQAAAERRMLGHPVRRRDIVRGGVVGWRHGIRRLG